MTVCCAGWGAHNFVKVSLRRALTRGVTLVQTVVNKQLPMHFPTVKACPTSVCSLSLVSAHGDTGLVKEAFIEEYHRRM